MGIGLTQLSAQLKFNMNKEGTGTISINFEYGPDEYGIPVYCDGQQVDLLTGSVTFRGVHRFKNWVFTGGNDEYSGVGLHSSFSDEVFKLKEKDHSLDVTMVEGDQMPYGTLRVDYNAIGNEGHHYTGTLLFDIHSQTFTSSVRAICN